MKTANYANNEQQVKISQDSPMYMEAYERNHIEQAYQSTKDQLLCWGETSNYMDSEFFTALERKDQGSYLY
ncbi:hypothetical protein D0817_00880 [Flavobacterium cupreum]|uniref:Uncharacterized protein n=1 Tax=Flavobacterium cupreum TaxID=2133766 RepID=A0A434ACX8_9FLAO|nr:hypothetical protein [Flavobacterium cupreum]RUT72205.1 hypothetical protein D0817_00880 [Flavobacterium cupreum]